MMRDTKAFIDLTDPLIYGDGKRYQYPKNRKENPAKINRKIHKKVNQKIVSQRMKIELQKGQKKLE
jgi:hypothetical protein